jgi:hypothetical protein
MSCNNSDERYHRLLEWARFYCKIRTKNAATKYLENRVSGGDNRSTGVTGSITCTFNVAAGFDIADTLMIEELLKARLFIHRKERTVLFVIAGSQLGAITAERRHGRNYRRFNGFTVTFQTIWKRVSLLGTYLQGGTYRFATALMPYV